MATLLRHARRLAAAGAMSARASTRCAQGFEDAAASLARSATAARISAMTSRRRAHATAGAAVAADDEHLLQSVVKVFTVHSSPNYFQPWQNKPQRETSGSGVVVAAPVPGGVGILTNAHVVADQTFVQVRRHGSSVKHQARVHAVGHECDLAVLTVDDPAFWTDRARREDDEEDGEGVGSDSDSDSDSVIRLVRPLPLGDVPHLQGHVTVMGFPQGGDNLSITSGVVSRVELTNYVHGAAQLLAIQLDAAINPGNSGGPAVQDGKVVGLAFQNLANADNIGYVIPTPIVRRFLEDIEAQEAATKLEIESSVGDGNRDGSKLATTTANAFDGVHAGFCALGIKCQATDNPALRAYLGMRPEETGVLVTEVLKLSPSRGALRKDDVLLEVDGRKVANDGTVSFRGWERVAFDHLVSLKRPGQEMALKVRRRAGSPGDAGDASDVGEEGEGRVRRRRADSGETEILDVTVAVRPRAPLVPVHQYDRLPSYYVFAGLVFSPLTQPHLHEFGDDWYNSAPRRLCDRALNHHVERPGQQVVILSQVLADEVNAGYQGMHDLEVRSVNGRRVHNLRELRDAVEGAEGAFLRLDFVDDRVLVVSRAEAEAAHARIMAKHRVPSRASPDLEDEA